jgi:hypothetical protein
MELSMKSRKELTAVTARRYRKAHKRGKGEILDEFVASTGYNRAYAAMLLREYGRERIVSGPDGSLKMRTTKRPKCAGGRPVKYGREVRIAAEKLWKRFGRVCGKRLVVILRHSLAHLDEHPDLAISAETKAALQTISAASLDRLLAGARQKLFLKGMTHTKPVSSLMGSIPVRTFSEWREVPPGYLQIDLVGHEGGNASGEFCFTLAATDICTAWTERRALLTKAARWVIAALEDMRKRLPFALQGLHSDNGSEFVNHTLAEYCREHALEFTRSRPGRKNDNCYVEQKNFDTVRKLVGYYRFSGQKSVDLLNELYHIHARLQNLIYPSQKLITSERIGSKIRKKHDAPTSPADRLLARSDIDGRTRWRIAAARQNLDPIELAERVLILQRRILALAQRRADQPAHSGATA